MLKPIRHRVVVKDHEEPLRHGSLHLAKPNEDRPMRATVVSVGQGQLLDCGITIPPVIKPGDTVIFHRQYGTLIDGYRVLSEYDILAVLEE